MTTPTRPADPFEGTRRDPSVSPDAMRWSPEPAAPLPAIRFDPAAAAQLQESLQATFRAVTNALKQLANSIDWPAVQRAMSSLQPDPPPEDPRQRALWLRRNRGTGPRRHDVTRPRR